MVPVSFYLLSLLAIAMLLFLFRRDRKIISRLLTGLLIWFVYLIILAQTDVLKNFELPPRIPLLVVIPATVLLLILVNSQLMKQTIRNTPLFLPIVLQSFRVLVELLIYATYQKSVFPKRATFEGLNFDILVGLSAIVVGVAVAKGLIRRRGILLWNIAAMCILALTVYSFISAYYWSDFGASAVRLRFVEFPYLLLPSVLLPTAIFLHIFSLKQVTRNTV